MESGDRFISGYWVILFLLSCFLVIPRNSDNASNLLAARDILAGNIFLKNWVFPPDNYYTLDIAIFTLGAKLFGFAPQLMYYFPALFYSFLVIISLSIICILSEGKQKYFGLTVIMFWFLFPSVGTLLLFSQSPLHILTLLYILIVFWLLRNPFKIWCSGLALLLLLLCNIGDPLSLQR